MNFISPLTFLWLAPVGGGILLLYLLKLRRRQQVVSSVMLWRQAVQDLQANAPFQRLKRNLLMLLQLAAALLLVAALARPFVRAAGLAGRSVVMIFDTSASMKATDVRGSRMGQARRAALGMLADLGRGDSAMVIGASARTRVVSPFTADRRALGRAISSLEATDTRSDLGDALRLAASMVGQRREPQIVIFSDGAVPAIEDVALGKAPVRFVRAGTGCNNVAITGMDVRRAPTRGKAQLFVALQNFGGEARSFDLEILRDDDLIHVRETRLEPGGRKMELFDLPAGATGRLTARITLRDDLEADNRADVFLSPQRSLSVLLLTEGNLFLEKALTLDPRLEVSKAPLPPAGESYDLVVCDGGAPEPLPQAEGVLLIGVAPKEGPVTASGEVARPAVLDWDRRHPLTRFVDFGELPIRRAQAAQPKAWAKAVVEGSRTTLVAAGEKDGRRWAYLAFDLRDSLFPMRVGFPIFMANCVEWLAAEPAGGGDLQVRSGEVAALRVPASAAQARVTDPSGGEQTVPVSGGVTLVDATERVGLYEVAAGNARRTFAVNLLSPEESDLTPGPSLTVGGRSVGASAGKVEANRDLWRWLLVGCLALLCFEWYVYHRRL